MHTDTCTHLDYQAEAVARENRDKRVPRYGRGRARPLPSRRYREPGENVLPRGPITATADANWLPRGISRALHPRRSTLQPRNGYLHSSRTCLPVRAWRNAVAFSLYTDIKTAIRITAATPTRLAIDRYAGTAIQILPRCSV